MNDLKPCPFCGRGGHEANDQYATGGEYCECEACGVVLKGGAKVWNRRPIDDVLRARLTLAEQVCYALVAMEEHGTAKHRMALDAALDAWKREAVKGGEG